MNIPITPYVLDEFENITRYSVRDFLTDYAIFNQSDYGMIYDFYSGKTKSVNPQAFINFKNLKNSLKNVYSKFQQFDSQLENIKFVELLQVIEECNDALKTLNNISRWARVAGDAFGYNQNLKIKYVLSQ